MDTTVEIANKVGAAEIIGRIVDDLKDEAEQYRKMVMETIEKIMGNLGAADIDSRPGGTAYRRHSVRLPGTDYRGGYIHNTWQFNSVKTVLHFHATLAAIQNKACCTLL